MGLLGLAISSSSFGLAKTFPQLVLARATAGALNGNVGVIKSVLAEITNTHTQAQAFGFIPIVWSAGSTVGPLLGGFLSSPAERFPGWFGGVKFWMDHPYFLPCLAAAGITLTCFTVACIFLEEVLKIFEQAFPSLSNIFFTCRLFLLKFGHIKIENTHRSQPKILQNALVPHLPHLPQAPSEPSSHKTFL